MNALQNFDNGFDFIGSMEFLLKTSFDYWTLEKTLKC